ncbi:hypothetical protein N7448_002812 [Penicillium atrosanguineum]|uniref:Uncharacterized protein n=1 Tax=Penicillium atrosanguineum TaxID=1132637 RepID=A0A9W9LB05_9EURO|nr:glycoside hydrolase family 3 protein [Penicillium atrosanguineum]KAJ5129103.1 hypothetical protein N7526_007269 [Penicillium atrosanguineum]KAJ5145420.1 hypothetical protein N7448_002812 [Penicillium atrosanguineum]KAJ5301214.1 glycoside hydrolase family 3 protein [Penicillium atrosanguineum]KAJ5311857.1 hypothetical protein N7476_007717 [Penicillium atrosanguineum]
MQSLSGLQVNLASQQLATEALSPSTVPITVSIYNPAESPITILKWNSPIDARAGVLGVFDVCDTGSGESIPLDIIKISRKLPPSLDDLVEISGGKTVHFTVDLPGVYFQKGHEYSVYAAGTWHAVWEKPRSDVTASQLTDLGSANRGEFHSNVVLVKLQ